MAREVEKWTRDGDHIPPVVMSDADAAAAENEPFDDTTNVARVRTGPA